MATVGVRGLSHSICGFLIVIVSLYSIVFYLILSCILPHNCYSWSCNAGAPSATLAAGTPERRL